MKIITQKTLFTSHSIIRSLNPSNAEAIFVQNTKMQIFLKTTKTWSCWYSLDSSRRALSNEYPYARVSVIFQVFVHHLVMVKLATTSKRVNKFTCSGPGAEEDTEYECEGSF